MFTRIKTWAKEFKRKIGILYMAYMDKRTPWYAKVLSVLVIAYALSPIDLIPDFIPIIGYLDDLILIPLGITLTFKLIPREVLDEYDEINDIPEDFKKKGLYAAIIISLLWLLVILKVIRRVL